MKLGFFTDLHISDRENDNTRYFDKTKYKMKKVLEFFKNEKVDIFFCLGDIIDSENQDYSEKKLKEVKDSFDATEIKYFICLGNHDITSYPYKKLLDILMPAFPKGYGSFDAGDTHFIILDSNYNRQNQHYQKENLIWDDVYIDEIQKSWLVEDLEKAKFPSIVLCHANLMNNYIHNNPHIIKNATDIRKILEDSGKVVLTIQGHDHNGGFVDLNKIRYVTVKSIVDYKESIPALILNIDSEDKIYELQIWDLGWDTIINYRKWMIK